MNLWMRLTKVGIVYKLESLLVSISTGAIGHSQSQAWIPQLQRCISHEATLCSFLLPW